MTVIAVAVTIMIAIVVAIIGAPGAAIRPSTETRGGKDGRTQHSSRLHNVSPLAVLWLHRPWTRYADDDCDKAVLDDATPRSARRLTFLQ